MNTFAKYIYSWILFVFLWFIIFGLLVGLFKWFFPVQFARFLGQWTEGKCRGYCSEDAAYDLPVEYHNFITPAEGQYILNVASPEFSDSKIVSGSDTNIRKSQTAWLSKNDPVIRTIIERVCAITNIPFENAEKMQVVRYEPNGYYNEHHDSACDDRPECIEFEKNGGQRKITMLIYLADDFEGGATKFPRLNKEYKMPKYSSLLFHPLEKHGNKCHPLALHAGMPVTSGIKYIANVWLRERAYNTEI